MSAPHYVFSNIKHRGFTLIELLVVLMIVGTMVSLVSLNIGAKPSTAKFTAKQLQSMLELAQDDAVLKGQILGWKITPQAYSFYRYKEQKWWPLTQDKLLRSYALHPELNYQLFLDKTKINYAQDSPPQITLLPDGSINNFELRIALKDQNESYKIYTQRGKIMMSAVEK